MRTLNTPRQIRNSGRALLSVLLLCLLYPLFGPQLNAQAIGDFRSRRNGNWSKSNRWEEYTGAGWTNTGNTPNSADGVITIRNGHNIRGNVNANYDEVIIENGGSLDLTQVFKVVDGPGIDLQVHGILSVNRNVRVRGTASAFFYSTSDVDFGGGNKLRFEDTTTATFDGGTVATANGTFQVEDNAVVQVNNGTVITNTGRTLVRNSGSLTLTSSTVVNQGLFDINGSGAVTFANGSIYEHGQDGSYFPIAVRTTFQAGSEARVTGVTTTLPTRLNHTFDKFTWNSTSQTADLDLAAGITAINDDFTVTSTGTGSITWDASGSATTIGGDYIQSGGDFRYSDTGSTTMTVSGNLDVNGGTFDIANTSGTPIVAVAGNFSVTGAMTESGTGSGTVLLNGAGAQTITANGTLSGNIHVTTAGAGLASLTTDLLVPGNLTETSGGLDLANFGLEVEGNLSITSALSNTGQILFSSATAAQLQLPAGSKTLPDVVIDKPASSLTILADVATSTTVIVRNGTLDTNGFEWLLPHGTTLYNTGTVTGNVTIQRSYSQNSDGWRMLAAPVTGLMYSDLNTSFWTQGAPWASKIEGTANLQSFDFASQGWTELGGADAGFGTGGGYIFYMYALDDLGAPILPATWTATGTPGAMGTMGLSFATAISDSYNLMGNQSTTNLDWDLTHAASTNMESSYATWDPSVTTGGGTTGYKYYDATSGLGAAGRYVAPFTSFMVAANAGGAQIVPTSSEAASRQTAVTYGKNNRIAPHFRLLLEGEGLAENETYLSYGGEATDESGEFDVLRLHPLSLDFVTLWSESDGRRLAFDGRTMDEGREIYDLTVAATRNGQYSLTLLGKHKIPDSWTVTLVDLQTGNKADLSNGEEMLFQTRSEDIVTVNSGFESTRAPRFRVIVTDSNRTVEASEDLFAQTDVPVLSQNYPNPFNPSTSIRYSIPRSSVVSLEVFDVLGRRLAILVDQTQDAGWHEVNFLSGNLGSGTYLYRLVVDGQSFSRPMLLLK